MISKSKGTQAQISGYYDAASAQKLKRLCEITRVAQPVYLREALDDLLRKYAATLRNPKK
jgi:hypothetical protein